MSDPRRPPARAAQAEIQRYRARLSGPLLDRIDLHVEVPAVPYDDLRNEQPGKSSEDMRKTVNAARAVQAERFPPQQPQPQQRAGSVRPGA